MLVAILLCLPLAALFGQKISLKSGALRTLTTAHEAHSLAPAEAVKAYPIHLRGIVTYYDSVFDTRQAFLFLHDASGSMFVAAPPGSMEPAPAGTLIDLQGVSGMGDFAPIISKPRFTIISGSHLLPPATPVSLTHLLTGDDDGQWVEVEGVVHSVFEARHDINIQLSMRDGTISITMPREDGRDYTHLVDSLVRVDANAAPSFNESRQMIGARLFAPNLSSVNVIEPGPSNVFDSPVSAIANLFRFSSVSELPRRVHVRGRVTLYWPGSLLCVRDETHGLCARTLQKALLALGETVDVAGFAEISETVPSLSDAVFQRASGADPVDLQPIAALPVTAEQALQGKHDSEVVQFEGQLIGRDIAASDTILMLQSGAFVYPVLLPKSMSNSVSDGWRNGSRLRITGILSVQIDAERSDRESGVAKRKSFRVLMRSPSDVVVLQEPSWWTPAHAVIVLAFVLSAALLVLVRVAVLSRRLKRQTQIIGESEERFRHLAQHDLLTGLPTRLVLRDRLDVAIGKAKNSNTGLGLLMLDLDKFKQINDTLGHHAGDEALKVAARRAVEAVRRTDTVARISGDEFVVLLTDLAEASEAELVAAKVVAALCAPFQLGDREVPLSASVGVCTAFGSDLSAESLLKSVDAALYHAKARGRNCFELYTDDMARANEEDSLLRAALEQSLDKREMEVHYQPMVSFRTGELTGFEALVRWRSKEMGMIMPSDFIPLAEQTGFIIPLGEWVLREACREIGLLEQQLGRSFVLAVNLSPCQIQHQRDLSAIVRRVLAESGRTPSLLELEITESMLMTDSSLTHENLMQLQGSGVRLAIDDFGVGFSSLSYITRFSIDRIKIDRSFISKCMREDGSLAVVRAMVAMAHGLSMQVVAEGVETAAEFHFLADEGCDTAQGYYLSRPIPAHELPLFVSRLKEMIEIQSTGATIQS